MRVKRSRLKRVQIVLVPVYKKRCGRLAERFSHSSFFRRRERRARLLLAYVEDRRRFIVASRREEIGTGPGIAVRHRDAVSGEQSAADLSILTITAEEERR